MSKQSKQMAEEKLHAYVDGRLDAAHRAEVEAWLKQNPADAARAEDYRQQNDMLQALYNLDCSQARRPQDYQKIRLPLH